MHTKDGKFVIYYPYFQTSTLYLSLLDQFTQQCVRAFENIFLCHRKSFGSCNIWIIQYLDRAIFASYKIWILQKLDHARFGSCKIWIIQDLDFARIG